MMLIRNVPCIFLVLLVSVSLAVYGCGGGGSNLQVDPTPPDDGTMPPDDGTTPPDDGTMLPDDGTMPPDDGTTPPDDGTTPPDDGTTPPDDGTTPPDDGTMPPDDGTTPPDDGMMPPDDGMMPPEDDPTPAEGTTAVLAGVPAIHGLAPTLQITVQPGSSEEHGNVEFSCPSGGPACVVSVTDDGIVEYETSGGEPSVMLRSLAAEEIEMRLESVKSLSDREIFSFGGHVITCQALSCPQPGGFYVRNIGDRIEALDTSGFEFAGQREGVSFAEKAGQSQDQDGSTDYQSLAGWMEHSMFMVSFEIEQPEDGPEAYYYNMSSVGHATGSNPSRPDMGSATWSGAMAGIVHPYPSLDDPVQIAADHAQFVAGNEGDSISGDATITIPSFNVYAYPSLNIEFSNIVNDLTGAQRDNMIWEGVEMVDGVFGVARDSSPTETGHLPFVGGDLFGGLEGRRFFGQFLWPKSRRGWRSLSIVSGLAGAFGARRD